MSYQPDYDHHVPLNFGGFEHLAQLRRLEGRRAAACRSNGRPATWRARATAPARSCSPPARWSCGTRRRGRRRSTTGSTRCPNSSRPHHDMRGALDEIKRVAASLVERDKFLVVLGGEHSVSVPVVEALAARTPTLSVLQIDAHADHARLLPGKPVQPCLRHAAHRGARAVRAGGHPQPVQGGVGGHPRAQDPGVLGSRHAARPRLDRRRSLRR